MLNPADSVQALTALFRRQSIAELETLYAALETQSRMSVFRRLSEIGYMTSYTHAGRFYTLRSLPTFDPEGLWCHEGVCFSHHGTLKSTVIHMVEQSDSGRTQHELQVRLRIRVHNTLLDLVRQKRIGREPWTGQYLYVSGDGERAGAQLALRRTWADSAATLEVATSAVIDVLLDLVRSAGIQVDAESVSERLGARGVAVTPEQVGEIFIRHGVKKTALSRSKRLPP
jgi:hypothetical protein